MAKFTSFDAPPGVKGPIKVRRATAEDFGGSGEGLQAAGKAITDFAELLQKRQERKAGLFREETIANDRLFFAERAQELQNTLPNGGEGITEILKKDLEERAAANSELMTTSQAKEDYKIQSARLKSLVLSQAIGVDARAVALGERISMGNVVDAGINAVRANPSKQVLQDVLNQLNTLVAGSRLEGKLRAKFLASRTEQIHAARADGILSPDRIRTADDAENALALIKTSVFQDNLAPAAYKAALLKAQGLVEVFTVKEILADEQHYKEKFREISSGAIRAADGLLEQIAITYEKYPERLKEAIEKLNNAIEIGNEVNLVPTLTRPQIIQRAQQLSAAVKDSSVGSFDQETRRFNAFKTAVNLHYKRIGDDPATYALQINQAVLTEYAFVKANFTPDNFDNYVAAQVAAQTKMGLRPRDIKLLTADMVAEIQADLSNIPHDAKGALNAHKVLQNLSELYRHHLPLVLRQLEAEKIITGVDAVVAGMNRADQRNAGQRLMSASRRTDGEWKALIKDYTPKYNEMFKLVQEKIAYLRTALVDHAGGPEAYQDRVEAITLLALHSFAKRSDQSTNNMATDVNNAHHEVLGKSIEVDGSIILPRSAGLEMKQVKEHGKRIIENLNFYSLMVPKVDALLGLKPEDAREQYKEAIINKGYWVTNSDTSGLILVDKTGFPVKDNQGVIIEMTWDDVRAFKYKQPTTSPGFGKTAKERAENFERKKDKYIREALEP